MAILLGLLRKQAGVQAKDAQAVTENLTPEHAAAILERFMQPSAVSCLLGQACNTCCAPPAGVPVCSVLQSMQLAAAFIGKCLPASHTPSKARHTSSRMTLLIIVQTLDTCACVPSACLRCAESARLCVGSHQATRQHPRAPEPQACEPRRGRDWGHRDSGTRADAFCCALGQGELSNSMLAAMTNAPCAPDLCQAWRISPAPAA